VCRSTHWSTQPAKTWCFLMVKCPSLCSARQGHRSRRNARRTHLRTSATATSWRRRDINCQSSVSTTAHVQTGTTAPEIVLRFDMSLWQLRTFTQSAFVCCLLLCCVLCHLSSLLYFNCMC